jgi:energy-coupling factor transporter ATP-binding protein EcfA2
MGSSANGPKIKAKWRLQSPPAHTTKTPKTPTNQPTNHQVASETRHAFVRDVLELLELDSIRDCVVGPPGAGLSFEELKRLSIGAEVVANPSLLFLDEPTSGAWLRACV